MKIIYGGTHKDNSTNTLYVDESDLEIPVGQEAYEHPIYLLKEIEKQKINENCQIYVNRLSDLLFVISRVINKRTNTSEVIWKH